MKQLDYDDSGISATYRTSRELPAETMDLWMREIRSLLGGRHITRILDLGSGTGRFSGCLAQAFNAQVVGVEPSEKMRDVAVQNNDGQDVRFVHGSAEEIPLPDSSVDMVFMSMVFHYFPDPERCLREAHRVLTPGGFLVIRNATKETLDSVPMYECFPDAKGIDRSRLPSRPELARHVTAAGFGSPQLATVSQIWAPNHSELLRKVGERGLSVMWLIPEASFEEGMARLKEYCRTRSDEPVVEDVDLLVARKPGGAK